MADIDIGFTAPVIPIGKGRPRVYRRKTKSGGDITVATTPEKTRRWESDFAAIVAKHAPKTVLDEPLRVDILAVMPRPKRLTRKSDPDGLVWCTTNPDADNIRKAVLDAMSAWWRDDALICAGETLKVYAGKGRVPCVAVRVRSGLDVATSVWITGFSSEGR